MKLSNYRPEPIISSELTEARVIFVNTHNIARPSSSIPLSLGEARSAIYLPSLQEARLEADQM